MLLELRDGVREGGSVGDAKRLVPPPCGACLPEEASYAARPLPVCFEVRELLGARPEAAKLRAARAGGDGAPGDSPQPADQGDARPTDEEEKGWLDLDEFKLLKRAVIDPDASDPVTNMRTLLKRSAEQEKVNAQLMSQLASQCETDGRVIHQAKTIVEHILASRTSSALLALRSRCAGDCLV